MTIVVATIVVTTVVMIVVASLPGSSRVSLSGGGPLGWRNLPPPNKTRNLDFRGFDSSNLVKSYIRLNWLSGALAGVPGPGQTLQLLRGGGAGRAARSRFVYLSI